MTLSERINKDMIDYMKSKDSFSLGVVRMVKGAIQLEKINLKRENPTSPKDMGLIMKEVSPKVNGRADKGQVSAIIKEKLSNL